MTLLHVETPNASGRRQTCCLEIITTALMGRIVGEGGVGAVRNGGRVGAVLDFLDHDVDAKGPLSN